MGPQPAGAFELPCTSMSLPAPAPTLAACPNCGEPLQDRSPRPPARYCPACGQETQVQAPTVRELAQQFGGAYFTTEGALWRTLKLLLFKPGELTAQYFAGRRKHYVLPLRLYLSISVLMVLFMRLSLSVGFSAVEDPDIAAKLPDKPRSVSLELVFARAGFTDGVYFCTGLPPWLCERVRKRLDVSTRAMVQQMHVVSDRVLSNAGTAMLVLMPAFALGLTVLYRNRGRRYTEHLITALHLHAFWALMITCMLLNNDVVTFAGMLLIPLYGVLALRRVYGGRWWVLLPRAALLYAAHLVLIALTTVSAAVVALLA